jgi:hypothetical protein
LYMEVHRICTRTVRAANKRGQKGVADAFHDFRSYLEVSLLEGKL